MSVALITRHLQESFLDEFVQYYLNEGVDMIYILQDADGSAELPERPNVHIIRSMSFAANQLYDVNQLYTQIRELHTWFLFLDCDEFISCVNQEKGKSIRDMLFSTYKDVDCIMVPWVMMACNHRDTNPDSLLKGIVHRWDHDKKHPHPNQWSKGRCRYDAIEVKSIFKGEAVAKIDIHIPGAFKENILAIDSVYNNAKSMNPFYKGLHEAEIANARMLCFHYRIFSKEECERKLQGSKLAGYKEASFKDLWVTDYAEKEETFLREKSMH